MERAKDLRKFIIVGHHICSPLHQYVRTKRNIFVEFTKRGLGLQVTESDETLWLVLADVTKTVSIRLACWWCLTNKRVNSFARCVDYCLRASCTNCANGLPDEDCLHSLHMHILLLLHFTWLLSYLHSLTRDIRYTTGILMFSTRFPLCLLNEGLPSKLTRLYFFLVSQIDSQTFISIHNPYASTSSQQFTNNHPSVIQRSTIRRLFVFTYL